MEDDLSMREAARRLGVHPNTIGNWCDQGLLAPVRLPRSGYRRIPARQVQTLIAMMEADKEVLVERFNENARRPFWDRLGMDDGDLPAHLPMGVNAFGQGPTEPEPAHHYECWCADIDCPLTTALQHAWLAGRRTVDGS